MNFVEEISFIADALTYVHSYAPDFPQEDRTSLGHEARKIIERFDVVAALGHRSARQHWLRLARQEIVAGFDTFPSDAPRGHRHLTDAVEFIQRAIRGVAPKAALVVSSDGVVHHAQGQ